MLFDWFRIGDDRRSSFSRVRDRIFAKTREAIVDFQPRQLGAYALMESRTDTGGLIQVADANGQQVSIAHIEADARPTRAADHASTKTLPGLCDEFAAKQFKSSSWDMNEREHRCSSLLTAPVAVAITSVENLTDLEAHRIAGAPAAQQNTHRGPHRKLFDLKLHISGFYRASPRRGSLFIERAAPPLVQNRAGGSQLLAAEDRPPLLFEGTNSFLIIVAVVDHSTQPLYPLESLRRHRVRTGENAKLLLHDRNA
jgi:hypothetical protein